MTTKETFNPNKTARVAGYLYLMLFPLGIFGIIYVPSSLIVLGDAATTASNIMANELLYRLSIVTALTLQIVNIFLALALYKLLNPVDKNNAVLMVILVLVAAPIAMLNELNHVAVLLVLSGSDFLTTFSMDQVQASVPLFLNLHEHGVFIAQIFWGLWLFPMGYLIFKSNFLPLALGILMIIGGFGYLVDSFVYFIFPDFDVTFSEFTFLGELLLPLWLMFKGVNHEQWENYALKST
ncbi:MAG: DUF4386 domain-containing protein [SAR324 cluster bacterium]|nr:DUF4386 domain-containing protein [SAR324 cluster bacterium]